MVASHQQELNINEQGDTPKIKYTEYNNLARILWRCCILAVVRCAQG